MRHRSSAALSRPFSTYCSRVEAFSTSRNFRVFCSKKIAIRYRSYSKILHGEALVDDRFRLSRVWAPTGGIAVAPNEDAHAKLLRAGFLRQAYSGIFHLLPLGIRVQNKLDALIDKYMYGLGASKLALSTISSEEMWLRSGRLGSAGDELFRLKDRKGASHILSPTHEEEITSLVAGTVKSYRDLPIRLYQISRKYRDEARPRHGLLRSREFVMKDLYTFDLNSAAALETYYQVREAYALLFAELKLPYLVAEADSGSIGGYLSHEFHFPTSQGEDHVISCTNCDYVVNEELAESPVTASASDREDSSHGNRSDTEAQKRLQVWRGVSRDRRTLINVWYPARNSCSPEDRTDLAINPYAVSAILPDLDTSIVQPTQFWENANTDSQAECLPQKLVNLVDCRLSASIAAQISSADPSIQIWPKSTSPLPGIQIETIALDPSSGRPMNLMRINNGDSCPRCSNGSLVVQRAIELGHTFHLGTRYSKPMGASVAVFKQGAATESLSRNSTTKPTDQVFLEMGCHGIGVTRIIGAVADSLADEKGLNWPRVMAPFEVVVIALKSSEGALKVYDALREPNGCPADNSSMDVDVVLDDRENSFGWKMQDADLVGYPVIVIVGRRWKEEMVCEVQCRRLKVREEVHIGKLLSFVKSLLVKL